MFFAVRTPTGDGDRYIVSTAFAARRGGDSATRDAGATRGSTAGGGGGRARRGRGVGTHLLASVPLPPSPAGAPMIHKVSGCQCLPAMGSVYVARRRGGGLVGGRKRPRRRTPALTAVSTLSWRNKQREPRRPMPEGRLFPTTRHARVPRAKFPVMDGQHSPGARPIRGHRSPPWGLWPTAADRKPHPQPHPPTNHSCDRIPSLGRLPSLPPPLPQYAGAGHQAHPACPPIGWHLPTDGQGAAAWHQTAAGGAGYLQKDPSGRRGGGGVEVACMDGRRRWGVRCAPALVWLRRARTRSETPPPLTGDDSGGCSVAEPHRRPNRPLDPYRGGPSRRSRTLQPLATPMSSPRVSRGCPRPSARLLLPKTPPAAATPLWR